MVKLIAKLSLVSSKINYPKNPNVTEVLAEVMKLLHGSFACSIIIDGDFDKIYVIKRSSPLLVAKGDGFYLLASDALPIMKYANQVFDLPDDSVSVISSDSFQLFDINLQHLETNFITKDPTLITRNLNGYPHYMLKEIEEIESVVRRLMVSYHPEDKFVFDKNF